MNKYQVKQSKKYFTFTEGEKIYCDEISVGLAYLYFQKYIDLI